jgi:hypothetical protein
MTDDFQIDRVQSPAFAVECLKINGLKKGCDFGEIILRHSPKTIIAHYNNDPNNHLYACLRGRRLPGCTAGEIPESCIPGGKIITGLSRTVRKSAVQDLSY